MGIEFEHNEDKDFFKNLLCDENENIEKYSFLFNFSDPRIKRREFTKKYNKILKYLLDYYGNVCQLNIDMKCNVDDGIVVDHIIPISSNKLNKVLRKMNKEPGKKIRTQSFGSNDIKNLIISCKKCNSTKQNGFLDKEKYKKLIDFNKSFNV